MNKVFGFGIIFALIVGTVLAEETAGARQVSASGIKHSMLITGSTQTAIYDEDSNIVWQVEGGSHDGYVLDNGNVLVSFGKICKEYKQGTTEVVWSHELSKGNVEMGTPQRLANGDTMLVERGANPRIIEVGQDGAINAVIKLQPETDNFHMQTRMARKRANGNYLVPHLFAFKVKEYTPKGEVVREIPTDLPEFGGREVHNWPFTAIELPNGNIHVNLTHGDKVAEFDNDNKVVWKLNNSDVAGRLSDPCGGQRLPNGNRVICSYGQKDNAKPKIFEVNEAKEVLWEFFCPEMHAHEVHILSTNGNKVTPVMR